MSIEPTHLLPMVVHLKSPNSVPEHIAYTIISDVIQGAIPAGGIVTVPSLCRSYGLHKRSCRAAIDVLIEMNFAAKHSRGKFQIIADEFDGVLSKWSFKQSLRPDVHEILGHPSQSTCRGPVSDVYQMAAQITALVLDGVVAEDRELPSVRKMAGWCNISTRTAHKALMMLDAAGMTTMIDGGVRLANATDMITPVV